MQRRIKAPPQETAAYQALIDHKQATLSVILSRIPDISTFAQLGELIGYSHEWVRQRLVQAPEKLYKPLPVSLRTISASVNLCASEIRIPVQRINSVATPVSRFCCTVRSAESGAAIIC